MKRGRIEYAKNEIPIVFTPDEITRMREKLNKCMREDIEDAKEWRRLTDENKNK